jgi:hypothetical protein
MKMYHVFTGGSKFGPISEADLKAMFPDGKANPQDLCWTEGMSNWIPVIDVIGPMLNSSPTPPPLPPPPPPPPPTVVNGRPPYIAYSEVPFYRKQWFFWVMYFTITPVALGLLLFGEVYYQKKGKIKKFGLANKILAGILSIILMTRIWGSFSDPMGTKTPRFPAVDPKESGSSSSTHAALSEQDDFGGYRKYERVRWDVNISGPIGEHLGNYHISGVVIGGGNGILEVMVESLVPPSGGNRIMGLTPPYRVGDVVPLDLRKLHR